MYIRLKCQMHSYHHHTLRALFVSSQSVPNYVLVSEGEHFDHDPSPTILQIFYEFEIKCPPSLLIRTLPPPLYPTYASPPLHHTIKKRRLVLSLKKLRIFEKIAVFQIRQTSYPRTFLIANFRGKMKMPKLGTKNG